MKIDRQKLIDIMKVADGLAYEYPSMEYRVYVDSDGEYGYEEWCGNNMWHQFPDNYRRYYAATFKHPCFDILWDDYFLYGYIDSLNEYFGIDFRYIKSNFDSLRSECEELKSSDYDGIFEPNDLDHTLEDEICALCFAAGFKLRDVLSFIEYHMYKAIRITVNDIESLYIYDMLVDNFELEMIAEEQCH